MDKKTAAKQDLPSPAAKLPVSMNKSATKSVNLEAIEAAPATKLVIPETKPVSQPDAPERPKSVNVPPHPSADVVPTPPYPSPSPSDLIQVQHQPLAPVYSTHPAQVYHPQGAQMDPIQQQPQGYAQQPQPSYGLGSNEPHLGGLQQIFQYATSFTVRQRFELVEIFFGWECENTYHLEDQNSAKIMFAKETSQCCMRQLCSCQRPFEIRLQDFRNNEILSFRRPLSCSYFCGACCKDTLSVYGRDGRLFGSIEQRFSILKPSLFLRDANRRVVLKIKGPCWPCCTMSWICGCNDVDFKLLTSDNKEIGQIKKRWSGCLKETLTDADNFSITFPADLPLEIKAVCMGAIFLLDFQYFEQSAFLTTWCPAISLYLGKVF